MSETPAEPTPPGPPAWLGPLAEACGDEVHRYCLGMVGDEPSRTLLRRAFAHVLEQPGDGPPSLAVLRLTTLAMAHNQCVEWGRRGQRRPAFTERDDPEQRAVLDALARLRPIGRDVSILRHGLGLRWAAMQRVCGESRARLVLQVCRSWRRMMHFAEGGEGRGPVRRPRGRRLSDEPETWAALREQARAFVELRRALRRAIAGGPPAPEGWIDEVWPEVERMRAAERDEEQRVLDREEATRAAEARAEAEAEQRARDAAARAEAEAQRRTEARRRAAEDDEARAAAERRRRSQRRWATLAVLAAAAVTAGWLALR